MDETIEKMTTKSALDGGHNFAVVGLIIALFAFSLSVTSPWIIDAFAPPAPTIEDIVVEKAVSIKDKLSIALKITSAKEDISPVIESKHWTEYWSLMVIVIALGGIINGALGLLRRDTRFVGGAAILLGMSAIIAQYMMIAFGILVVILLIVAILSSFGMSF